MLIIARGSGYADRLRAYKIKLDGHTIGKIRDGESKQFPLAPGRHELLLTIDWATSKKIEFTVSEVEDCFFQCGSSVGGNNVFSSGLSVYRYAVFQPHEYISLEQVSSINPAILKDVAYRHIHPINELRGFNVTTLFYGTVILAVLLTLGVVITNNPYNPLTHTCVTNYSQKLEHVEAIYGGNLDEHRRFCKIGSHPEITQQWAHISRIYTAVGLAVCAPILLCTLLIKTRRANFAYREH